MLIPSKASIQRCITFVQYRNIHKIPGMDMYWRRLPYSKHLKNHRISDYLYSPLCFRSYQEPGGCSSDSHLLNQSRLSPFASADYSIRRHHMLAISHSCSAHFENKNSVCQDLFQLKNHRYNHTKGNEDPTLVKHIIRLLTSLSLSYMLYKISMNIYEQYDLLPTAACMSQKPYLYQTERLQAESTQQVHPSSKTVIENSEQRKIGDGRNQFGKLSLVAAIERAQMLCKRRKEEVGSPGIVVCVSVDGRQVYAEGFGYADMENQISMQPNSVLRIASISKAITATIVAKAWEKGQIDLNKTVQNYVPSFPQKEFMGEKVEITVKQLLNHSSGIRHYKSKTDPVYAFDKPIADLVGVLKDASLLPFYKTGPGQGKKPNVVTDEDKKPQKINDKTEVSEMVRDEYYLMKYFSTITESLALFANDPLVARPGTKFVYTTFGYTLLSAVIESALKRPFTDVVKDTLTQMGLTATSLDLNNPIIYNRARYYVKDEKGKIVNAPYVDNSYKWAGGGLISTAEDVVKFGNILLYSAQHQDGDPGLPGFLKSRSIRKFWTPQVKAGASQTYGLGFFIRPANELLGMCDHIGFGVGHTGGAIGASSALFILPRHYTTKTVKDTSTACVNSTTSACKVRSTSSNVAEEGQNNVPDKNVCDQIKQSVACQLPQGVVVCIMLNMISVSAQDIAEDIARTFENVDFNL